jgi:hypothetical protein
VAVPVDPRRDRGHRSGDHALREALAMKSQIEFALAHPVFDPETQILPGHFWKADRDVSAGLTCNIGMT